MTQIDRYDSARWAEHAANRIQEALATVVGAQGRCSVMLTGGNSAAQLYEAWSACSARREWANTSFYFGDERCVPPDSNESNYGMAMRTLFRDGVARGCRVVRMQADRDDLDEAAFEYAEVLPERIDILLLGVGEDGHVASLFPGSEALEFASTRVLLVESPKRPTRRLTVSPPVIESARTVFVLAPGRRKREILSEVIEGNSRARDLPAMLAKDGIWLTDVE